MRTQTKKVRSIQNNNSAQNIARSSPSKFKINTNKPMTPIPRTKDIMQSPRYSDFIKIKEIKQIQKTKKEFAFGLPTPKQDKIDKILQIKQTANKQYEKRLKTDSFFLKNNKNPFLAEKPLKKLKSNQKKKNIKGKRQKRQENKIKAIEKIKITKHKDLEQKISYKNKNLMQFYNLYKAMPEKAFNLQSTNNSSFDLFSKQILRQAIKNATREKQLQEIISIQQTNYFKQKRKKEPFDLFQVLKNPKSIMFKSGYQQLQDHKFSFNSMSINIESNFNEACLKALSSHARTASIKFNSTQIPDEFKLKKESFTYKVDLLSSKEMLTIANGQLTPQTALEYFIYLSEEIKECQQHQKKSDEKQQRDDYLVNRINQGTNTLTNSLEKVELDYYKNILTTDKQQKQAKISRNYLLEMKSLLQNQINFLNNNIRDPKVFNQINKKKDMILVNQLDNNVNYASKLVGSQKKIYMNKLRKDKTQTIKINTITKTLKDIRVVQTVINSLSNSKSKSKPKPKSKQLFKSKYKKDKGKSSDFNNSKIKTQN